MNFVQIKINFDQFFFKLLNTTSYYSIVLLIMSSINLSLHTNSARFCMHRHFGAADYEIDYDFENIANSKLQKLNKFLI